MQRTESRGRWTTMTRMIVAFICIVFTVVVLRSFFLQAQIGTDAEVFKTVDALFTSINRHDREQLDDCEKRLMEFRTAGRLPLAASRHLESIVHQAQAGQWDMAARRLYDFMLAQHGHS